MKGSEILITMPVGVRLYTAIVSLIMSAICFAFFNFEYTSKQRVYGVLVTEQDVIKVYPPNISIVKDIFVEEDSSVKSGQLLYTLINHSSENEFRVYAPEDGVIVNIAFSKGQIARGDVALFSLLPVKNQLQAEVYVPTDSIGFINEQRDVMFRYNAFPYQKFGQHSGRISNISKMAIEPKEVPDSLANKVANSNYKMIVELPAQTVKAYGKNVPLKAGMMIEADILLDTRKLYEWVFEPLYSINGV
ncbi:HlyD family efflux transporter periplasmic adaptor subunit [Pseudoalteromonas umbrosa]|uniref:HlyD family efflux transporter periplasmic adaptor subunit n=1 Tax=Pseudoalteromonas umbrosa TaxID=3048489 RepID=UPI0024C3CF48|nr:HlyD family efflux transporter periplasmic adaptor subunit [Pseudoalteromonas sp. B95]MDK1288229.1 HlyD family efflux transporter periplasmic adaptor subunit [Pseudoalteromonas sp. B95]